MQKAKTLGVLGTVVAFSLAVAPAAIAGTQGKGGGGGQHKQQGQQQRQQQGAKTMMMTEHGVSVPYLLKHSYNEAIHAHESVGLGLNDMANNHLENVRITLGAVDPQKIQDTRLRDQIQQLRSQVDQIGENPTAQNTQQLVSRFVTVFNQMPANMGGGGGGQTVKPSTVMSPAGLLAGAYGSAAETQVDSSLRNFSGARLHIQQTISNLEAARESAQRLNVSKQQIQSISQLRQQAQQVNQLVRQNSPKATEAAGQLVTRIGNALPTMVEASGGGGGKQKQDRQMQQDEQMRQEQQNRGQQEQHQGQ